ncbi:mannan endo-1,6-alpha-mannosidase DCW1 [Schizosaccharomyces japonicus yFS275]|uniref:mannan endo-1,6-alpha-mannosidase n=1 Tax=Schizosaccharomyces japonicus (strain yFS275 / FY16936) TaxID=402676 RepID=B6JVA3_SCHJY|nr:mannan endo-1,6-alpha-mannosidase DCW1 [Schizosaccharomyces japonicus yFS275]EEB05304.1 mannan endo-1,6-alpha-mannosidase DCW1 [Schizosaccharomyces japonicus yFS275]
MNWSKFISKFLVLLVAVPIHAFTLDANNNASVVEGMKITTNGLMDYYSASGFSFVSVYWWLTGSICDAFFKTIALTGNKTYYNMVNQIMVYQAGDNFDYAPESQKLDLGNDDQAFWGLSAMTAAEFGFSGTADKNHSYLAAAERVVEEEMSRWDDSTCGGGIRWQLYSFRNGYNYKNSVTNGAVFQIAARLARYTGNETYVDIANKLWDWSVYVGFLNSTDYTVIDGGMTEYDCYTIDVTQWSYNVGLYLGGAAYMYNYTDGDSTWKERLDGLVNKSITTFFKDGILYEPACEIANTCNADQTSFKGYLARFLGYAMKLAPYTRDTILPLIKKSAEAAALACSGGRDGYTCGGRWYWNNGTWDGNYGVGDELSALEVMQTVLIDQYPVPLKAH